MNTSFTRASLLATLVLFVPACGQSDAPPMDEAAPAMTPVVDVESTEIAALRQVAEGFRNVDVALSMGYVRDPSNMCITAPMEGMPAEHGAMGIHFFRPDLLGITATEPRVAGMGVHTDWEQPGVLLYEPQADGSLQLVAIENVVFEAGWTAAGNTTPPSFLGEEYVYMANDPATEVDEAHGFEPHYELHIWIPRDNPRGMFEPFNPAVTCDHHGHGPS
jgi:hypothetical protein